MANINQLRQRAIINNFGLGMGNTGINLDDGSDYEEEEYEPEPQVRRSSPQIPEYDMGQERQQPDQDYGDSDYVKNDIRGIDNKIAKLGVNTYDDDDDSQKHIQDTLDAINRVYNEKTVDLDRLHKLLDDAPNIEDYSPSWGRRLAASLQAAGEGGYDKAQKTLVQPYAAQLGSWKEKTGPFQAASTAEHQRNVNERTLAGNVVTSITAQDRAARQQKTADEKNRIIEENNRMKNEIEQKREQTRRFLAENSDWEVLAKGTTVRLVNPKTGQTIDTGMKTDLMTELDLQTLKNKGLVEARQAGDVADIIKAYIAAQSALNVKQAVPGQAPAQAPNTATERIKADNEQRLAFWNAAPQFREFMHRQGESVWFDPRPKFGTWLSSDATDRERIARYDAMMKAFDPNYVPPSDSQPGAAPVQSAPPPPAASTPGTGRATTTPAPKGTGRGLAPSTNQPISPSGRQAGAPPPVANAQQQAALRRELAIKFLQEHGKVVNEETIQTVIRNGGVR